MEQKRWELANLQDRLALFSDGWRWWSGPNNEHYTNGPFMHRPHAVEALEGDPGYVTMAKMKRVRFEAASLIDAQYFESEDYFSGDAGEPERDDGCEEADEELQKLLDAWAEKWQHTFKAPELFEAVAYESYIEEDGNA